MIEVEENVSGFSVGRKCEVCKDNFIFVYNSKDKDRAIKSVNDAFNENHLECMLVSPNDEGGTE